MKSVESVPEDATIAEAARVMKEDEVGLVPVKNEHDLSGVITRREIAMIAAEKGSKVRKTRVREVLRPCIVFCQNTDSGEDALNDKSRSYPSRRARQIRKHFRYCRNGGFAFRYRERVRRETLFEGQK